MPARAVWKGTLTLAELAIPVSLHAAASTAERVAFHILNAKTGHRVRREFVDSVTGQPVPREDQVKGYETSPDRFVTFTDDEIAAAVPEADKCLRLEALIPCAQVDRVFFDKPYHMAPVGPAAEEPFALVVAGLRKRKLAGLARTVLFRRLRTVLIRPDGPEGLLATTLQFADEVRPAREAFSDLKERKIEAEMLDLAKHIIATKSGSFDPATFDDRYGAALAELVQAKIAGRRLKARPAPKVQAQSDLLAALRESAGQGAAPAKPPKRRKAG